MPNQDVPRRAFLKLAALGSAGVALTSCATTGISAGESQRAGAAAKPDDLGLKLGVASYSLRNFPRAQAIQMTRALGTRFINLKSMHLPYEASAAEIAAARQEI